MSELTSDQVDSLLNNADRLYAPVEVAYILNLKQATVQELCRSGALVATKVRTQWRITGAEVRRYLKDGPANSKENTEK